VPVIEGQCGRAAEKKKHGKSNYLELNE
jgi:hypothetical protein